MSEENNSLCPCGCGELDIAYGRVHDNEESTYFNVTIVYCPVCKYISTVDAEL